MPNAPETAVLPPVTETTEAFERWLGERVPLVPGELAHKHQRMAASPLAFLHSTFYRWMQLWMVLCPGAAAAPHVLAVGDLHIDAFGTWRDIEGRLVWGANDFDDSYPLPYTLDLVRLATSARLAAAAGRLRLTPRRACDALLAGYATGLRDGGRPFIVEERHEVLRQEAHAAARSPERFWDRMDGLPVVANPPPHAAELLQAALPRDVDPAFVSSRAAAGSVGRPCVAAICTHNGGQLAREALALAPSACAWALNAVGQPAIHYGVIVRRAVRSPDPLLLWRGDWIVRRLAPDCGRIDATVAQTKADQAELLRCMGAETANIHLGSAPARVEEVRRDLANRPEEWLRSASKAMAAAVERDHDTWTRSRPA